MIRLYRRVCTMDDVYLKPVTLTGRWRTRMNMEARQRPTYPVFLELECKGFLFNRWVPEYNLMERETFAPDAVFKCGRS